MDVIMQSLIFKSISTATADATASAANKKNGGL